MPTIPEQQQPLASLICRRQLRERIPVSDMTIWRWVKAGVLATPIKINGRNYWRSADVDRFVERST